MGSGGWRSRGYLPHFDSFEKIQHITFHLADSLPKTAVQRMAEELKALPQAARKVEHQRRVQKWLDAGHGECHLHKPELALLVEEALVAGDPERYVLFEWCVMPNHVHVLAHIGVDFKMAKVIKDWKGATAVACNRLLGRSGSFWYPEYHDRFIRNENHYADAVEYIHQNPVKAGLCATSREWPISSARYR